MLATVKARRSFSLGPDLTVTKTLIGPGDHRSRAAGPLLCRSALARRPAPAPPPPKLHRRVARCRTHLLDTCILTPVPAWPPLPSATLPRVRKRLLADLVEAFRAGSSGCCYQQGLVGCPSS